MVLWVVVMIVFDKNDTLVSFIDIDSNIDDEEDASI